MFHILFKSHLSTVLLYLELVSNVYPDENHWTVVRLRLDLLPRTSLVPSKCYVLTQSQLPHLVPRSSLLLPTVKRTWERGWSNPLCIIFFQFPYHGYYTGGPKTALPQAKQKHARSSLKPRHVAWTLEPNIGLTYMILF